MDELRCYDVDRLTRAERVEDRLAILGIVADAGAVIVDAQGRVIDPTSDLGEVDYYLRTLFAARERTRILARTRDGKRRRAAEGAVVNGRPPYGYDVDDEGRVVIVPHRARVVQRILADAAGGRSLSQIADSLAAEGVAPPSRRWSPTSVRKIVLRSETYAGTYRQKVGGETYDTEIPAIASADLAERALASMQGRFHSAGRPVERSDALCVGRIRCACGTTMSRSWTRGRCYYRCRSWRHGTHRVERVDAAVWREIRAVIERPELLSEVTQAQEGVGEWQE